MAGGDASRHGCLSRRQTPTSRRECQRRTQLWTGTHRGFGSARGIRARGGDLFSFIFNFFETPHWNTYSSRDEAFACKYVRRAIESTTCVNFYFFYFVFFKPPSSPCLLVVHSPFLAGRGGAADGGGSLNIPRRGVLLLARSVDTSHRGALGAV